MTSKKKVTEIQSAVVYRVTDKVTHEVFYLVASDSQADVFYAVRYDRTRLKWSCPCDSRKPCKHERAINEVLSAKRAALAEKIGGDMPQVIATLEAEQEVRAEQAQATIAQAQLVLADERRTYAPPRVGNFNVRGASAYISDAEMAEMKARVAARQAENAPLNATPRNFATVGGRSVPMR